MRRSDDERTSPATRESELHGTVGCRQTRNTHRSTPEGGNQKRRGGHLRSGLIHASRSSNRPTSSAAMRVPETHSPPLPATGSARNARFSARYSDVPSRSGSRPGGSGQRSSRGFPASDAAPAGSGRPREPRQAVALWPSSLAEKPRFHGSCAQSPETPGQIGQRHFGTFRRGGAQR